MVLLVYICMCMLPKFRWVIFSLYAFNYFHNLYYNIFYSWCIPMNNVNSGNNITIWCDVTERQNSYQRSGIHPKQIYYVSNTTSERTLPFKFSSTSHNVHEKVGITARWDSIKVIVRAHDAMSYWYVDNTYLNDPYIFIVYTQ